MEDTYYDDRDDLLDKLDDLRSKLSAMEEYEKSEDLRTEIGNAEGTEYTGSKVHRDPYAERGLSRSDFINSRRNAI